jgi:hypothetical protein
MNLVLFVLAVVGLTNIIVESELFSGLKAWLHARAEKSVIIAKIDYMTNCYQCSGFWSGFIISLLSLGFDIVPHNLSYCGMFFMSVIAGWAGSLCAVVGFYVVNKLEKWWAKP